MTGDGADGSDPYVLDGVDDALRPFSSLAVVALALSLVTVGTYVAWLDSSDSTSDAWAVASLAMLAMTLGVAVRALVASRRTHERVGPAVVAAVVAVVPAAALLALNEAIWGFALLWALLTRGATGA